MYKKTQKKNKKDYEEMEKRLFPKTNSDGEVTFWKRRVSLSLSLSLSRLPAKQTNKRSERQEVQSLTFVQRSHLICFHFT